MPRIDTIKTIITMFDSYLTSQYIRYKDRTIHNDVANISKVKA